MVKFSAEVKFPEIHARIKEFEFKSRRSGVESPEAKLEMKNIGDIVTSMKSEGKIPGTELSGFKPDPVGKIDLVDKVGSKVKFETPEGSKSYSDAIKDSSVSPDMIAKKSVESLGNFEGSVKTQFESQYAKTIKDLPARSIDANVKAETKVKNEVKAGSKDPNMEKTVNEATPENKAIENETKSNKEVQKKLERLKEANAKEGEGKLEEDLDSPFDKKGKKKSEKMKEEDGFLKKNWKSVLAALGAGFLTYELVKARKAAMSGCWVYYSNGEKYKIRELTCDPDYLKSTYNIKDTAPTKCKFKEDNTTFVDEDCDSAKLCANPTGGCSRTCSSDIRVLADGDTKYEYRCVNASMSDAMSDLTQIFGRLADNTLGAAEGGIGGFLKMFGDIGKYLLFGVAIVLIIFVLYKVYQIFFSGQNRIVVTTPIQQKFRKR